MLKSFFHPLGSVKQSDRSGNLEQPKLRLNLQINQSATKAIKLLDLPPDNAHPVTNAVLNHEMPLQTQNHTSFQSPPNQQDMTCSFGKYRGKSFKEIAANHPKYVRWALAQEMPRDGLEDFVHFLRSQGIVDTFRPSRPNGPGRASASSEGAVQSAPKVCASLATARPTAKTSLGADYWFVCELCQDNMFLVRCDYLGKQGPRCNVSLANLSPDIWDAIGHLPGARMSQHQAWLFDFKDYHAVCDSLQMMGNLELIPSWVVHRSLIARTKNSRSVDCTRLPQGLLPYQREGVEFGVSCGGRCLLGDEMGLGKTVQSLAIAAQYLEDWPVLVVCPSSLRWLWKDQCQAWLPLSADEVQVIARGTDALKPEAKVWIISYTTLAAGHKSRLFQHRREPSC